MTSLAIFDSYLKLGIRLAGLTVIFAVLLFWLSYITILGLE